MNSLFSFIFHHDTKTKGFMSSRNLCKKTKIGATPSSGDCSDDEYLLGLSTHDLGDIFVRLGDNTLTSAEKLFPNLSNEIMLMM